MMVNCWKTLHSGNL